MYFKDSIRDAEGTSKRTTAQLIPPSLRPSRIPVPIAKMSQSKPRNEKPKLVHCPHVLVTSNVVETDRNSNITKPPNQLLNVEESTVQNHKPISKIFPSSREIAEAKARLKNIRITDIPRKAEVQMNNSYDVWLQMLNTSRKSIAETDHTSHSEMDDSSDGEWDT